MKSSMPITGGQLFWLTCMFDLGMSAFIVISPTVERVKNDAWLSLIISAGVSMLATWIGVRLSLYYPDKTFIEYLNDIIGHWVGKIIGMIYVVTWIVSTGMLLREVTDIFITSEFDKTPGYVFITSMTMAAVYMLSGNGIQSLGRSTEVIGLIVIVMVSFTFAFDLPNVDLKRLLPIYITSGPEMLLYGSIPAASFMAQTSYVTMIVRFVKDPKKNAVKAVWGTGVSNIFLVLCSLFEITTFGADLCKRMWNPIIVMAQYISVEEIVQNVDSVILVVCFLTAFVRISLFLFLSVYGTGQIFRVQHWKSMLPWVAGVCIVIAMIPHSIIESTIVYPRMAVEPFVFPALLLTIPLLLWFIAFLRTQRKAHRHSK